MRDEFHADTEALLHQLVEVAGICDHMLEGAVHALVTPGAAGAPAVIARDNEVDAAYREIQQSILELLALQAPVASDLRLLSAMLHVNIHVERLGDYATHVARMAELVPGLADHPELARTVVDMGTAACHVSRTALRSFADRDLALAHRLPQLDDRVDQCNRDIFRSLVQLGVRDESNLEWATHMIVVARSIERYGDHGVDVGEQTVFVVTGETVELSSNDPRVAQVP
jgi:phosphate transport system protein